jgi:hypothetical protein
MTTFYCLRFKTPPTWRARSQYLYPPGTGCPSYTPRHWVPFSSPAKTRRATVEVFDPASIWVYKLRLNKNYKSSLYSSGTDRTGNVSSIIACSLVAGEICPKRCPPVTAVVLYALFTQLLLGNVSIYHNMM